MTFISSWDVKKATVKLPPFGLSFEFVRLDGSSRCVACGGNSITMGLSMSRRCSLTTSERFWNAARGDVIAEYRHPQLSLATWPDLKVKEKAQWTSQLKSMGRPTASMSTATHHSCGCCATLSFPKIPSGLNSHRKAESSHH